MYLTDFICKLCGKKTHAQSEPYCYDCFKKLEENKFNKYKADKKILSIENRLEEIENWIYDFEKILPEIKSTVSMNRRYK